VCLLWVHAQLWGWLNLQTGTAAATFMRVGWRDPQDPRVHPAELLHPGKPRLAGPATKDFKRKPS